MSFTKDQHAKCLAQSETLFAEAKAARAADPSGPAFSVAENDLGPAFAKFVASCRAAFGENTVEYKFPDGCVIKIVCMHDARAKAERAKKLGAKP